MREFDIAKPWIILASSGAGPVETTAAAELARFLGELRAAAEVGGTGPFPVHPANAAAPEDTAPIIVLNAGDSSNGFSWRAGSDRVEIYGDSPKGLLNGVYDFLGALGIGWERPGAARVPRLGSAATALAKSGAYEKDDGAPTPILPPGDAPNATLVELVEWAARNKAASVSIPRRRRGKNRILAAKETAQAFGVSIETDGPDPEWLVPRRLFLLRPELFSMIRGRRRLSGRFCPTNPDAVRLAGRRAERFFAAVPWADAYRFRAGAIETPWCACPTCRAFSPVEQSLMAANAVAAALERAAPETRLVMEIPAEPPLEAAVAPRGNILMVRRPVS